MLEMDQRELESELTNMMKLHAEGVKQVKKMERIVRESDQRAKVSHQPTSIIGFVDVFKT